MLWITSEIKLQIRERDRRLLIWISEGYWNAYKISRNKTTDVLRKVKANYYKRQFKDVKHDPKNVWKTVKKILNRDKKSSDINFVNYGAPQISSPIELAKCFKNYFMLILAQRLLTILTVVMLILGTKLQIHPVDSIFKLFQCQLKVHKFFRLLNPSKSK